MKATHSLFGAIFICGVASAHEENLIVNGRFDSPDITNQAFQAYTESPSGFGWSIVSSGEENPAYNPTPRPEFCCALPMLGVDLCNTIWPGIGGTTNADGVDQSIDIDGDSSISQSFATEVGQTYTLSLNYTSHPWFSQFPARNPGMVGYVTVAGTSDLVEAVLKHNAPNMLKDMDWRTFSQTFVADSALTTITLAGDSKNANTGFVVDNVSVRPLRAERDSSIKFLKMFPRGLQGKDESAVFVNVAQILKIESAAHDAEKVSSVVTLTSGEKLEVAGSPEELLTLDRYLYPRKSED